MNTIIKNIFKTIGLYVGYLILVVIIFYITGMYIWTTPPTKLVLMRILVFPIFLSLATILFIWIIKRLKVNKKDALS